MWIQINLTMSGKRKSSSASDVKELAHVISLEDKIEMIRRIEGGEVTRIMNTEDKNRKNYTGSNKIQLFNKQIGWENGDISNTFGGKY